MSAVSILAFTGKIMNECFCENWFFRGRAEGLWWSPTGGHSLPFFSFPVPLNQPSQSACQWNENHKSITFFWSQHKHGSVQRKHGEVKNRVGQRSCRGLWDSGTVGQRFEAETGPGVCEPISSSQCTGSLHWDYTHFAALMCCSGGTRWVTHTVACRYERH